MSLVGRLFFIRPPMIHPKFDVWVGENAPDTPQNFVPTWLVCAAEDGPHSAWLPLRERHWPYMGPRILIPQDTAANWQPEFKQAKNPKFAPGFPHPAAGVFCHGQRVLIRSRFSPRVTEGKTIEIMDVPEALAVGEDALADFLAGLPEGVAA